MKEKIKLGVVCLARKTFDFNAAKEIYDLKKTELKKLENIELTFVDELVIEPNEAEDAGKLFRSEGVDGVVIISGTFHLGHLALTIDKYVKKPILLWAFNELPYNGGKIRLNSVCGLNLNASNLYKSGNDKYAYVIGDSIDEVWVDALRAKVALENSRVGILGYRAHGFFNVGVDDLRVYKDTGILIDHFEIADAFNEDVTEEEILNEEKEVRRIFNCSYVTEAQVKAVAKLCASTSKFMSKNNLTAVAVRCWPEFADAFGISPCAMMSILQSRGYILGCEGDVEAVLSMIALRAMGAETPFLADLSQVNFEEDYALMWHCGVAPCNLWDGKCEISLDTYFAGGRGVTADFVMKSGNVNIMRIDSARGITRIFFDAGEALPMEKLLKGTYAKVRFENSITDVVDKVVKTGVAHHVALVYGEYRDRIKEFAKLMNWEVI